MNTELRAWLFVVLVSLGGCGRPTGKPVVVAGTLTLDGQPVDRAMICLTPRQPHGSSGAPPVPVWVRVVGGQFHVTSGHRLAPGPYELVVQAEEPDSEEVLDEMHRRQEVQLADRNRLWFAANRRGSVPVVLTSGNQEVLIELTTR
uniref:Carboxypeptidase regulatory-like domain-containing protein n=1 Tax=Schlesneria paludicola TaxID=360056 RepID=A0A7C4LNC6_9PLAN